MRKGKDIKDCKQYNDALRKSKSKSHQILFPLHRVKNFSTYSPYLCPNCSSDVIVEGKFLGVARTLLSVSGELGFQFLYTDKKHYCLNKDCVYHYFEVNKNSEYFHGDVKKIIDFVDEQLKK